MRTFEEPQKITVWLGTDHVVMLSTKQAASGSDIVAMKKLILDDISVVSGATPSSQNVINETIDHLFKWIVVLRSGDFIEGEFLQSPEFESRISAIEKRVESMEGLLEELQHIWKVRGPQP